MINSPYLDLAIGLAVTFFLASLVVSGLNEGINWIFRVRAKFLWAYLYDLFDPDRSKALPRGYGAIANLWRPKNDKRPGAGGSSVMTATGVVGADAWLGRIAFALDPIDAPELGDDSKTVKSMKQQAGAAASVGPVPAKRTSIKNVPPGSLAQALMEAFADVGRSEITAAVGTLLDSGADPDAVKRAIDRVARGVTPSNPAPTAIVLAAFRGELGGAANPASTDKRTAAASTVASALLAVPGAVAAPGFADAWAQVATTWPAKPTDDDVAKLTNALVHAFPDGFTRQRIENALDRLGPNCPLYPTLRRLWEGALGKTDAFRTGIENYLDGELRRLSGYYRRSIRVVVFGLALAVALVGSIDTFAVTRALWRNPDDRAALVQEADRLAASSDTGADADKTTVATAGTTSKALAKIQKECNEASPPDDATITTPEQAADAYGKVRTCVADALDRLTGLGVIDRALWVDRSRWAHEWSSGFVWHAAGILLTSVALLLGAPFWFDTIKRLTGIRKGMVGET